MFPPTPKIVNKRLRNNEMQMQHDSSQPIDMQDDSSQQITNTLENQFGPDKQEQLVTLLSNMEGTHRGDDQFSLLTTLVRSLLCNYNDMSALIRRLEDNSAEAQERRRSVVVVGLPEPDQSLSATKRAEMDNKTVSKMLDVLDIPVVPVTCYRMGRLQQQNNTASSKNQQSTSNNNNQQQRGRLLKVVLPASMFQWRMLGASARMRKQLQEEFGRIFIRPSLSKEQLAEDRQLRTMARQKNELEQKEGGRRRWGVRNWEVVELKQLN